MSSSSWDLSPVMVDVMALAGSKIELEGLEPKLGVSHSFSCNLVMFVALAGEGPGPECLEQQLNVSFVISPA